MSSPRSTSSSRSRSPEQGSENTPKASEGEAGQQQMKPKDRQKFFEEAFQQDMEHYLSTSYLQIAERRGSMSSMEVNVDMLEQMDLMDVSDHDPLDVFLNSGGEDNSTASPMQAPDAEPFGAEITLQVPTQAEIRHKLASLSSTGTDSASQDTQTGEDEDDDEEKTGADAAALARPDQPTKDCVNRNSSGLSQD
ncbi:dystrobrevin binding protein 1b isoform X2 [Trichomycterus rosablanca]|uniref:dystrobrevin binding protein 1b isoform X2 n=1 Tax=Trichomycterus rosablanca TaxID=2290929 RepID=UPI002F3544B5